MQIIGFATAVIGFITFIFYFMFTPEMVTHEIVQYLGFIGSLILITGGFIIFGLGEICRHLKKIASQQNTDEDN